MKPPPLVQPFSNLPRLNWRIIIQLNRERIPPQPQRTRSDIGGRQQARNSHRTSQLRVGDTSPALLPFGDRTSARVFCLFFFSPFFQAAGVGRRRLRRGGTRGSGTPVRGGFLLDSLLSPSRRGRPNHCVHPVYVRSWGLVALTLRLTMHGLCGPGAGRAAAEGWKVWKWKWSSASPSPS